MEERWIEIERIDQRIEVNRRVHERIKTEIDILNVQLQNVDTEYRNLNSQKMYLGKKAYGDPKIRRELIESGMSCSNRSVREAAEKLKEHNTDVKWDDDVKSELISLFVLIDRGDKKKIKNPNIIDYLAKVGKLGYANPTNH